MSRFPFLLVALALLVPAASAQVPTSPDPTVTLSITGLPLRVDAVSNTTLTTTLQVTVDNLVCLPGPGILTVLITGTAAREDNSTGNLTVDTIPPMAFQMPQTTITGSSHSDSKDVQVTVRASGAFTGAITLTATVQSLTQCTGVSASGTSPPATLPVTFTPAPLGTADPNADVEATPGFELPLLLAALGAIAVALRRKA